MSSGREWRRSRDKFASTINKINPVLFVFLHGEKYEATLTFVWPTYDCAIIHSDHGKQTRFRLSGVSAERLLDKEVRAIGFPQISTVEFSDAEKVSRQAVKDISGDLKLMFDGRDLQYFFPSGRISQVTRRASLRSHVASAHRGTSTWHVRWTADGNGCDCAGGQYAICGSV